MSVPVTRADGADTCESALNPYAGSGKTKIVRAVHLTHYYTWHGLTICKALMQSVTHALYASPLLEKAWRIAAVKRGDFVKDVQAETKNRKSGNHAARIITRRRRIRHARSRSILRKEKFKTRSPLRVLAAHRHGAPKTG